MIPYGGHNCLIKVFGSNLPSYTIVVVYLLGFLQEVWRDGSQDSLHHSEVLFAVMGLKEKNNIISLGNCHGNVTALFSIHSLLLPTWKRVDPR